MIHLCGYHSRSRHCVSQDPVFNRTPRLRSYQKNFYRFLARQSFQPTSLRLSIQLHLLRLDLICFDKVTVQAANCFAVVNDGLIACSLIYFIYQRSACNYRSVSSIPVPCPLTLTKFIRTRGIINWLMAYTVNSGAITMSPSCISEILMFYLYIPHFIGLYLCW